MAVIRWLLPRAFMLLTAGPGGNGAGVCSSCRRGRFFGGKGNGLYGVTLWGSLCHQTERGPKVDLFDALLPNGTTWLPIDRRIRAPLPVPETTQPYLCGRHCSDQCTGWTRLINPAGFQIAAVAEAADRTLRIRRHCR